jgi:hypothetical protein
MKGETKERDRRRNDDTDFMIAVIIQHEKERNVVMIVQSKIRITKERDEKEKNGNRK